MRWRALKRRSSTWPASTARSSASSSEKIGMSSKPEGSHGIAIHLHILILLLAADDSLRRDATHAGLAARDSRALPAAPAPRAPACGRPDAAAPLSLCGGCRRHPDGFDQRPRARALSHAVEPVRPLRPRAAGSTRLRSAAALRVLGARRVSRAHDDAAVVAARDARLSRPAYRLVGLAPAQR